MTFTAHTEEKPLLDRVVNHEACLMCWEKLGDRKLVDVDGWAYCPRCSDKYFNEIGLLTPIDGTTKE